MSLYSQSGAIPAHVRVIAVTPWIAFMVQLLIKVLSSYCDIHAYIGRVTLHTCMAGWMNGRAWTESVTYFLYLSCGVYGVCCLHWSDMIVDK